MFRALSLFLFLFCLNVVDGGLIKLKADILLALIRVCLVNLGVLWQLAVRFQTARLLSRVLHDDVGLGILVLAQTQENDIAIVDPHLLPQLAANVAKSRLTIKAKGLKTAIAEHLGHLRVLLAILLEDKLALLALVLILTATTVLTTLS